MRLVISAGESSGDLLAAQLIRQLKRQIPHLEVAGLAGPEMVRQGVEAWFSMDELNVMGLQEVIRHLPRLLKLRRQFQDRTLAWQPDAFISVDAPDFNLGLARALKARGLKTIHYVSPSIWAWRPKRVAKIARSVDGLMTLFPFESALYRNQPLQVRCVGHPLADEIEQQLSGYARRTAEHATVALLPGSRMAELRRHVPLLIETAQSLQAQKTIRCVMPLARPEHRAYVEQIMKQTPKPPVIDVHQQFTRTVLQHSDVAIAASGTVTLEAFLLECPQVVFYRLAPLTYGLARAFSLVQSEHIALPNIITQQALVPEHIQGQATAERLAQSALTWLDQPEATAHYRALARTWRHELRSGTHAGETVCEWLPSST